MIKISVLARGIIAMSLKLLLTVVLEKTCQEEVTTFLNQKKKNGRQLYRQAWAYNVINLFVGGTLTYYVCVMYICTPYGVLSWPEQVRSALGVVLIEGFLYYIIHKAFHEVPGLYWIHGFHHKFNSVILPSTANAVSIPEFIIAYMVPLMVSMGCVRADEISGLAGSTVVGITNLLIHTPWMEQCVYHWGFVSAHDHMEHHRRFVGNYGAPVLHMDRIFHRIGSVAAPQDKAKVPPN